MGYVPVNDWLDQDAMIILLECDVALSGVKMFALLYNVQSVDEFSVEWEIIGD